MTIQSSHQVAARGGRRVKTLAIAMVLAGAATMALAQPVPAQSAAHGQRSPLGDICGATVGLEPGQAQYDGCVASLSDSLDGVSQGRALWTAHDACLQKGLKPGSPDLAVCTLRSSQARPADASGLTLASAAPGHAKSYFSASNRDRFHREQLACAELGLNPVAAAFDSCVAGLRSSLFEADNPSQ